MNIFDSSSIKNCFKVVSSKITDEIYQGCYLSSMNKQSLQSIGITHILIAGDLVPYFIDKNEFVYIKFIVDDEDNEQISQFFPQAYEFIDSCIENKGKVLIHCAAGISRSSTFTISFLIKKYHMTYTEAFDLVRKGRNIAYPNRGFIKQLKKWEEEVLSNENKDK